MKLKAAVFAIGMALASAAQADNTISNVASWNGYDYVLPFGVGDTATYGQTITTGDAGLLLESFTFYLRPLSIPFTAEVGTWLGDRVGEIVYQSSPISFTGDWGYNAVTASPGIHLEANAEYVLYFTTSGIQGQENIINRWAYTDTSTYEEGQFVFINNGNDRSHLTATAWTTSWGGDLVFSVNTVAAIPEPSVYGLLLIGLGVIGFAARRKIPG